MDKIVDQSGPHMGGLPKMKGCPKNAPSDMQIAQNWQFGGLNRRFLSYFLDFVLYEMCPIDHFQLS